MPCPVPSARLVGLNFRWCGGWWRVGVVRPDGRQSDGMSGTAADGVLGCGGHCHIVAADGVGGLWCSPLCVDRQAVRMSARVGGDALPSGCCA